MLCGHMWVPGSPSPYTGLTLVGAGNTGLDVWVPWTGIQWVVSKQLLVQQLFHGRNKLVSCEEKLYASLASK